MKTLAWSLVALVAARDCSAEVKVVKPGPMARPANRVLLKPDGKMSSSGRINITGPVKAGETTQQTTEQNRLLVNQYTPGAQGWYVDER